MVSESMLQSLLRKQLENVPESQPYQTFCNGEWQPSIGLDLPAPSSRDAPLDTLTLISWNIDFMVSEPRARMAAALRHLETLVAGVPPPSAVVIFLQEMMETGTDGEDNANDLSQIADSPWIQQMFNVTDLDSSRWASRYGTVTLVDRRLTIAQVSRLCFISEYGRDALFVDIHLDDDHGRVLRLCNVHLDSMHGSMRPIQWKALAEHLQDDQCLAASIVAGDCNATQPRDREAPQENGFTDAYLVLGGAEDSEEGATWGFQSVGWERWGRKRLDKQVFWGTIEARSLQRIGMGVVVDDEVAKDALEAQDMLPFVTDHYGLMGEFRIKDGFKTNHA